MPRDFPDFKSLLRTAEIYKYRKPYENESEEDYRDMLANYVEPLDYIESLEIRNKVGWNKFSEAQNMDMLERKGLAFLKRDLQKRDIKN